MLFHIFLFVSAFLPIYSFTCSDTIFSGNPSQCLTNTYIPCRTGGSAISLCTDDCFEIKNACVNNTVTEPERQIIYPRQCITNNNFISTDINCNFFGNGTKCPLDCRYENNSCNPILPVFV